MKKYFIHFIWLTVFINTSCISDFDFSNISTDVEVLESLVLPIGESEITVEDLLKKFGLPANFDTTGSVISYQRSFKYEFVHNKLNVADTIIPFNKTIYLSPVPIFVPAFFPINLPPFDATIDLPINGSTSTVDRVDSVLINFAFMKVQVDVSPDLKGIVASDFKIEFDFPDNFLRIHNGIKPTFIPVTYQQNGYLSIGKMSALLNGANSIPFKINVYLKSQNKDIIITENSNVKISLNFEEMDISVVYGIFNIDGFAENSIDIPFNPEVYIPNSFLKIADPKLDITATTNVGMNFKLKVDYLKAYNDEHPDKVFQAMFYDHATQSKSSTLTDTFNGPEHFGNWTTKKFNQFNSNNGEFDKMFDNIPYPNVLDYKVSVATDLSRSTNFFSYDNILKLDIKTIIPLEMKGGSYFTLTDTIQNLNIGTVLDNMDSAVLVLKIKNGLPLKARYRMTFWKSNLPNDTIPAIGGAITTIRDGNELGYLTSEYFIKSPSVNPDGIIADINSQTIKIALNKEQIEALKLSKFIVYTLLLEGSESEIDGAEIPNPVSFTTKNSFNVKLGLYIKGHDMIQLFNN